MENDRHEPRGFHWIDYTIFAISIALSSAIGIFFACSGGKQKTTSEYLLGNRKQKVAPVAMSLIVSFQSAIMMLGFPAEMYAYGTQYWLSLVGYIICSVIVTQTFVPLLYPLKVTSCYEYLTMRFQSHPLRLFVSFLGIVNCLFYMGIVLFGPATALEAVTGFPVEYSVILVTAVVVFYTTLGGIKAVIWTDVLQFVLMLVGMLAILIRGTIVVGGVKNVMEYLDKGRRIVPIDFNPDPRTRLSFWNLVVGGIMHDLSMGLNQSSVQRFSSTKTLNRAKIVMLLTSPGFALFGSLAYMEGLLAYAYFAHIRCDPLEAKYISNTNQIIPYFVLDLFQKQPGLPGLFLVAIFSASLSTLSSGLNAMSAILWCDFLKPCFPGVSEVTATLVTKSTVVVLGGLSIGIAFLVMEIGGPLHVIMWTIVSSIEGPIVGVFLLGSLFPRATAKGALTGCIVGFGVAMWLSMGSSFSSLVGKTPHLPSAPVDGCYSYNNTANSFSTNMSDGSSYVQVEEVVNTTTAHEELLTCAESFLAYIYSISFLWYGIITTLLTLLVGLIVSHITGPNPPNSIDPKYIIPVFDNLFCYLPSSVRDKLRYKKDYEPQDENGEEREIFEINGPDQDVSNVTYRIPKSLDTCKI